MSAHGWLAGLVAGVALAGRASLPQFQEPSVVVTRHAEKASDDPRDPSLSAAGQARAEALAARLRGEHVVGVYATAYRRTQQTAAPTARAAGVGITTYDAKAEPAALAADLRAAHRAGTVLIVGHSNTAPAIAAALCDCEVPSMADDEFGTVHRITLHRDGRATLRTTRD